MFWTGLLANQRGVFAVQRVRFRSGVPYGSRVGRYSRIAVRMACCLLCQLFHHVECVEHQLRHVDCARANPHHRGNNLLLYGRHAFTYLVNFLDQVFARVSTSGQNLDSQLAALSDCEKIFQEKISGAKDDRPELQALLEWVREGDTVHVTKLDRLARNTRHLLEVSEYLQGKGVALNILNIGINTATPTGKLMLTMIGAIATFEREMMLERQAEGIALAKLKGKYKGRKPTARSKTKEVIELVENGTSKAGISHLLKLGITSIYRIIRVNRPDLLENKHCND